MGAEKIRVNKVSSVEKPTTGKNKSVDRTVSKVRRSRAAPLSLTAVSETLSACKEFGSLGVCDRGTHLK